MYNQHEEFTYVSAIRKWVFKNADHTYLSASQLRVLADELDSLNATHSSQANDNHLRTEFVTLKVNHHRSVSASAWNWQVILQDALSGSCNPSIFSSTNPPWGPDEYVSVVVGAEQALANSDDKHIWRLLEAGEFVTAGDQFYSSDNVWRDTTYLGPVIESSSRPYRRRINIDLSKLAPASAKLTDQALGDQLDAANQEIMRLRERLAVWEGTAASDKKPADRKMTEGDTLATIKEEDGRPMPKGPPPGLQAVNDVSKRNVSAWGLVSLSSGKLIDVSLNKDWGITFSQDIVLNAGRTTIVALYMDSAISCNSYCGERECNNINEIDPSICKRLNR